MKGIGSSSRVGSLRNFDRKRIGRLGEFRPSLEEDAKKFNLAVDRRPYTGTGHTLAKMAAYIREGSRKSLDEAVRRDGRASSRSRAPRQYLQHASGADPPSYVKKNVRYRPDPDNIEFVQKGEITLCVPGAQMCIPVGDCDDETVALGSLMGAYGIPVKILKQTFGDDAAEEHVLLIFKTDDGKWLAGGCDRADGRGRRLAREGVAGGGYRPPRPERYGDASVGVRGDWKAWKENGTDVDPRPGCRSADPPSGHRPRDGARDRGLPRQRRWAGERALRLAADAVDRPRPARAGLRFCGPGHR